MPEVLFEQVEKRFNEVVAVRDLTLDVPDGEFLVILGPTGCGKTTMLRCVAGLERPNGGKIRIGDRYVFSGSAGIDLPPHDRDIGMVFQHYALYPHMTVFQNVAFGLKMRGLARKEVERRAAEALEIVELTGFESRRPRTLSGGQQQRVALARTIAARPSVLLFDEPLSSLDPDLRTSVRTHLKRVHETVGATSLYVTHDQSEAMILADRIAVMKDGGLLQIGEASEIYSSPRTVAVAEFTANPRTNLLKGEVHRAAHGLLLVPQADPYCFIPLSEECAPYEGRIVIIHVRPEDLEIVPRPEEGMGRLTLLALMSEGASLFVHLRFGERSGQLLGRAPFGQLPPLARGQRVSLRLRRGNIFSAETERLLGSFGFGEGVTPREALPPG